MITYFGATPWWVQIGAALLAASAAIAVPYVQHHLKRKKTPSADNADNVRLMEELWLSSLEADARRARIYKAHGKPAKGKALKLSVVAEVVHVPIMPQGSKTLNVPTDEAFVDVMIDLITQGSLTLRTDEMQEGSFLRDIYEPDQIQDSDLLLLYANGNVLYIEWSYQRESRDTPLVRRSRRVSVEEIKRILRKMEVLKKDETLA